VPEKANSGSLSLTAEGKLKEAEGLLEQLLRSAEAGGRGRNIIEILLLRAMAIQARGNAAEAITTVKHALPLPNRKAISKSSLTKAY